MARETQNSLVSVATKKCSDGGFVSNTESLKLALVDNIHGLARNVMFLQLELSGNSSENLSEQSQTDRKLSCLSYMYITACCAAFIILYWLLSVCESIVIFPNNSLSC